MLDSEIRYIFKVIFLCMGMKSKVKKSSSPSENNIQEIDEEMDDGDDDAFGFLEDD